MTQVYGCNRSSPLSLSTAHDPNSEIYYTFQYRAPTWRANTEYVEKTCGEYGDLVTPTTPNGFLYNPESGGVSGPSEPTWVSTTGETLLDGTVTWSAIPDAFNLVSAGDSITSSEWETDVTSILSEMSMSGGQTYVKVAGISSSLVQFFLTNTVEILRSSGITEKIQRTIKVKVREL